MTDDEREALDQIMREADGCWPDAREAILATFRRQGPIADAVRGQIEINEDMIAWTENNFLPGPYGAAAIAQYEYAIEQLRAALDAAVPSTPAEQEAVAYGTALCEKKGGRVIDILDTTLVHDREEAERIVASRNERERDLNLSHEWVVVEIRPVTDQRVTAPDGEEFLAGACQGHSACPVDRHEHGCFADDGTNCDHPEDHESTDPVRCGEDVQGTVPSLVGSGRIDPCSCVRPAGHEPPCVCAHGEPDDLVPEPTEQEKP